MCLCGSDVPLQLAILVYNLRVSEAVERALEEGETDFDRFEAYIKAVSKALDGQADRVQKQSFTLTDRLKMHWHKQLKRAIGALRMGLQLLLDMLDGKETLIDGTSSDDKTVAAARRAWGNIPHLKEDPDSVLVVECAGAVVPYGFEAVDVGGVPTYTKLTLKGFGIIMSSFASSRVSLERSQKAATNVREAPGPGMVSNSKREILNMQV